MHRHKLQLARRTALAGALVLALSAPGMPQAAAPYKIGATLPMTGPLASTGILLNDAAQVAVDNINKAGGVHGHPLALVTEDTQGTPQGGISAMRRIVEVEGVQAILTMLTNVVSAQLPVADQLKVPFITVAQAPNLVNHSAYTFAHAQTLAQTTAVFGGYWRKHNVKRVYQLVPNNAVGPITIELTNAVVAKIGAQTTTSSFNYGETDYRGLALRVKDYNPDAIMLSSSGGIDDTTIVKQIRESGENATIYLTADYWNDPTWQAAMGPYIANVVLADVSVDPKAGKKFIDDFRAKAGSAPSTVSAEIYDIVYMLAAAIDHSSYNGEAIAKQLAVLKGVPSVFGGTITMQPDHYSPPIVSLYQVRNNQLTKVFSL